MAKKISSKRPKSFAQKYAEIDKAIGLDYPDIIDSISDSEVVKAITPTVKIPVGGGRALKITCDSADNTIQMTECEYNGPIPFGFREPTPSMIPIKGVFGKFIRHFGARNFYQGDSLNAWWLQNCFIYKACTMPGDDAVSCGYEIVPRGTKDKKLVEEMMLKFNSDDFNLDDTMRSFECYKRGFGGAILVPCFEEEVDMSAPLVDYSQLKGKTFLGWSLIEPYYLCPMIEPGSRELMDPTYKFYLQPTHWDIYGGTSGSPKYFSHIHRSWIFFRRNMILSKMWQPTYKYFGPSVPQMVVERLYSAEVCANESSMLLRSKRSFVIEADVRKMAANPEYAKKFLKNCQGNSDNWGVRVVPRNSNAKQMDTYLSECFQLTTGQYGILCAEIDIPAPKFMMAQLTGFANSGNYEIKLYAANVKKIHDQDLRQLVEKTARIEAACRGKDTTFCAKFGDVDLPTITEQAEIMYEEARAMKFREEAKAIKKGATQSPNNHKGTLELHGNGS